MDLHQTLSRERAMLLVIDLQTKLLPHIAGHDEVVAAATALLDAAELFALPGLATVQYVKGLGPAHPAVAARLAQREITCLEKAAFSACRDDACRACGGNLGRNQVIVTGIEAHVCVQQTVLDLLSMGLQPFVCADAVSSRRPLDRQTALERMRQAGAVVTTTEAVLFELCELSGTPQFKRLREIVKRFDEARAHVG